MLATSVPLLVLDVYEHHMDCGAQHARYGDAFFRNVSWQELDRRYEPAVRASEALRESGG